MAGEAVWANIAWSAIAPCASTSATSGKRCARSARASIGGMPRPAWIRIGTPPSRAELEDRSRRGRIEAECLRPRVQLDPARPEREAALALGYRVIGRVEPAERVEPPSAAAAHASTRSLGVR